MKLLQIAFFVGVIAVAVAQSYRLPYLNSTGWIVNSVPYERRIYWMQQAKEAVLKASGPWFILKRIPLTLAPFGLLEPSS